MASTWSTACLSTNGCLQTLFCVCVLVFGERVPFANIFVPTKNAFVVCIDFFCKLGLQMSNLSQFQNMAVPRAVHHCFFKKYDIAIAAPMRPFIDSDHFNNEKIKIKMEHAREYLQTQCVL